MNRFQISLLVLVATLLGTSELAVAQRGWAPQAKDAAIGTGIGGAAGAIINKRNRVVGGIIGGAVGGAAGYAIGKGVDNRRKSAAQVTAAERDAANARQEANQARQEAEQARQETVAARQAQTEAENRPVVIRRDEVQAYRSHRTSAPIAHRVAAAASAPAPVATAPVMTPAAALPTNLNAAFLTNPTYGDPDSAYPTSEYRRKSW